LRPRRGLRVAVGLLAWIAASVALSADEGRDALTLRALAATCTACHGTEGRAAAGETMPSLAGRDPVELAGLLRAFREGSRPATVMHQLSKGYTVPQLEAIAAYFAAQAGTPGP
jgi:sulfide dehydrogenase cytochrome subunit